MNISSPVVAAATIITVAVIGCATFLCYVGKVPGSDIESLLTLTLTGVVAFLTGHAVAKAVLSPPPTSTLTGELTASEPTPKT